MKILVLVMVFIAFCGTTTEGSRCFNRREKSGMSKLKNAMECMKPTEQLVALPVPKDYDYVLPSMAKVNRCSGMLCWGMNQGCKGVKSHKQKIKVEAMRMTGDEKECTHVEIDVHEECACGCIMSEDTCKDNKVFDGTDCSCKCSEEEEAACKALGESAGMWQADTCTCVCTKDDSVWIKDTSKCMKIVEE